MEKNAPLLDLAARDLRIVRKVSQYFTQETDPPDERGGPPFGTTPSSTIYDTEGVIDVL